MNEITTAFIDRDGTINVDNGYIGDPDHIEMIPGAADAIKRLNDAGCRVIILTNQSGVARGYFSTDVVDAVNGRVIELVERSGGKIDDVFYCPHFPEGKVEKYSRKCDCRKPGTGLIRQAMDKHRIIKMADSVVIGDKVTDVKLGQSVGAATVMVATGHGVEEKKKIEDDGLAPADFYAANLPEAVDHLLNQK
ncbi:MAG: D,D-heptose 1,7-bisphosphate phosphatase [bacterium]|nr:MAG: D,D-heptose 1,7-bisphosphate phosphatase [bacterium]